MKILTVVFDLDKGGTQRTAQNFCEAYSLLGHDSRLIALYGEGPRLKELQNHPIFVWIGLSDHVKQEIQAWKPDVVHLHSLQLKYQDVYVLRRICAQADFVETKSSAGISYLFLKFKHSSCGALKKLLTLTAFGTTRQFFLDPPRDKYRYLHHSDN